VHLSCFLIGLDHGTTSAKSTQLASFLFEVYLLFSSICLQPSPPLTGKLEEAVIHVFICTKINIKG
jgi:hypothetical protein